MNLPAAQGAGSLGAVGDREETKTLDFNVSFEISLRGRAPCATL